MAASEHLKDLRAVWGDSCQSMWAELLSINIAESFLITNYANLGSGELLTDKFFVPEIRGRLDDTRKDTFLQRSSIYKQAVITNRIVVLSASFETYFSSFLDAYIKSKSNLYDKSSSLRTPQGDKLLGEVMKVRGLSSRIEKFSDLAPSKIKSIKPKLTYLNDVYELRNILAHRAGTIDSRAASNLVNIKFNNGSKVGLTTDQLLLLAKPVMEIAASLDTKLGYSR